MACHTPPVSISSMICTFPVSKNKISLDYGNADKVKLESRGTFTMSTLINATFIINTKKWVTFIMSTQKKVKLIVSTLMRIKFIICTPLQVTFIFSSLYTESAENISRITIILRPRDVTGKGHI